ncbi:exopolyphosphatase [Corynebacterium sp. 4HC-13]|uniref:Ppx/GppA phosphatase family protein n=1 Tax=Corynebacterium anserum TaxID=2684406 RepID=UPI0016398E2D|nr:Ppx/GppA phosphatase family protein [Corynebacterium anserum]MBC2681989.1 exopolyphosphatase [Corynebacterium anserum]
MTDKQGNRRFAGIDCGTNSIRLVISEVLPDGSLRELNRDNIIVRLGQGVDATGRFADEALERVDAALATYADRMVGYGVEDVMMGATSATRDAENREEFFSLTARHLSHVKDGLCAEVISGEREAELSFNGAVMDLGELDPQERVCVIDLGGGSTEFVVRTADGAVDQAYSANMGCVRLTERYLHTQPPTKQEIAAAQDYVQQLLKDVQQTVELATVERVVGVAGTMTTMSSLTLGLTEYDPERNHMSTHKLEDFRATARDLLNRTTDQRMQLGPMHPGRADVIGGGAVVVDAITTLFLNQGLMTITISEKDILDGILAEVVKRNR